VGRDERRMAWPHGFVAAVHAGRKANSDLPGDVFRRDLQDLRCLREGSRCRDRLPSTWRLKASRGRDGPPGFPAGESSAYQDHRRMGEVLAEETATA
jgi:hypothetical protein